jgi:predicted nucleic acid-binding protein
MTLLDTNVLLDIARADSDQSDHLRRLAPAFATVADS